MSSEREEYTGIANGVKVKAGVSDFLDGGDRTPGYIRVLALKSEAFL